MDYWLFLVLLSSISDLSQMLRAECDITPELLRQTLTARKHKHLHSASNGESMSEKLEKKRWQTGVIWVGERIWLTCNLSPNLSVCVSGFTLSSSDYREKEDMYDEIIRLKKVKLNKNEHVVAKWEIALQPESSGWIDDVSKHLCPPEVALICLQSDSDLTPQNLHMHSPHVSLLFSSVSPGAEVWQPEDESQTTPPRGR